MIKLKSIVFVTFFSYGSQTCFSQSASLVEYKTYFNKELKDWTISFTNFQLDSFKKLTTIGLDSFVHIDMATSKWKEFYKLYKPALSFSNDGCKFIDIYSYDLNLEKKGKKIVANYAGEQEVALYDLKSSKESRILFCGISSQIQEVDWISNSKFILVGREIESKNVVRPLIYLVDLNNQKIFNYRTSDKSCIEKKDGYFSPKIKKIDFVEE